MIRIEHLSKSFGKFVALNNIELEFSGGKSISLIGPNGSGKTTLIKTVLGMVMPTNGQIFFKNKSIKDDSAYRSVIGYMPQIGRFPENMTIGQVFDMMKDIRKDVVSFDNELVVDFGLNDIMDKKMRTLSGGTRQKVGACLAFLFNPEVLILDEPTAGLDPLATEILKEKILKEKNNGKLILITSHILSDLDEIVSDVLYLYEGNVKFFKSLIQLKADTSEINLSKAIARVMQQKVDL
jgi:Cu-processing system ATP-binding protein